MRSIYNGSISFGLVVVPIKLYAASEDHDLECHQVHAHDGGRIKYKRVCEGCGEVVPNADIAKQYEIDGQQAILTDDDLSSLASENKRVIEVAEFVPADQIDPTMVDKSYYIGPDGGGALKAYALLAKTLGDSGKVAIVQFTLRSKNRIAAMSVTGKGDVLVLHTLLWPDEVRTPALPDLDSAAMDRKRDGLTDAEIRIAAQLVSEISNETVNFDKYRDTYKEELRELVMAKLVEPTDGDETEVSDLLAKLEASVKSKEAPKRRPRKMAASKPRRQRVSA
ncbi:DNA end-binding protein Ku [Mycolicibacterium sp. BK634]|uniref:non-homologous end joining protein Ku n=1 Tax=Mycolicibacterium sp. BK634 TaxID=2587099 RepID=UPI001616FC23|nr:Ku protein [Mycolicibacterium sp. BK634]MBB3752541.1 DNA end-binding protein Ku [Mycolicibacterium sp. BK634]